MYPRAFFIPSLLTASKKNGRLQDSKVEDPCYLKGFRGLGFRD